MRIRDAVDALAAVTDLDTAKSWLELGVSSHEVNNAVAAGVAQDDVAIDNGNVSPASR
jgi:hypothetical protein